MTDQVTTNQLLAYLQEFGFRLDNDYLREALRVLMQLLIEREVSAAIEANPYERKQDRVAYRNGYRERNWQTAIGEIRLRIPKLRRGTYYPSIIESLEQAEQSLLALLQEAILLSASPEGVEDLLDHLGFPPLHRSDIWEFYETLHDLTEQFHNYRLQAAYPYLWLEVLNIKVKKDNYKTTVAVAVAIGVKSTGEYEVVGFETANHADDEALWRRFLNKLVARGLADVQLIISDSYYGIREAIEDLFPNAIWQHSRTYTLHNILKYIPLEEQPRVVAAISTLFLVKPRDAAMLQLRGMSGSLLPHLDFSVYSYEITSTLVLIRLKQLLEHQADVIGVFSTGERVDFSENSDLIEIDSQGEMFELYSEMTPTVMAQNFRMAG